MTRPAVRSPRTLADVDTARRALLAGFGAIAAATSLPTMATPWPAAPTAPSVAPTSFFSNFQGLKLQDQEGRPVQPATWLGKLVLVNFVYTGCSTICPAQTRALAEMQRQLPAPLRTRVRQLSLSLDPENDTPKALREFALRMGADLKTWTFATGRPQDVERLSESLRLFRPGADVRKPDDHSTALWLVDAQGQLRMRYGGNPPDVPRLLREIAALDQMGRPAQG